MKDFRMFRQIYDCMPYYAEQEDCQNKGKTGRLDVDKRHKREI